MNVRVLPLSVLLALCVGACVSAPVSQATHAYAPGESFDDCHGAGWCPRMVVIPSGSFIMSSPENEAGRSRDEGAQREVAVGAFAAGAFEVTFDEWAACVREGGCANQPSDYDWGRGRHPVIDVTWEDAELYVRWLSAKTGKSYRLLSEEEWEYAARAGTGTPYATGAAISTAQANFNNVLARTQTVGAYPPNAFGLYDMHGNVWEWVADCYEVYSREGADGAGHDLCPGRVVRGGSWNDLPEGVRSANRYRAVSSDKNYDLGFRVARTLEGAAQ